MEEGSKVRERFEDVLLLVLKIEERALSQEMQVASRREGKGNVLP